jgi:hypothetical protein
VHEQKRSGIAGPFFDSPSFERRIASRPLMLFALCSCVFAGPEKMFDAAATLPHPWNLNGRCRNCPNPPPRGSNFAVAALSTAAAFQTPV